MAKLASWEHSDAPGVIVITNIVPVQSSYSYTMRIAPTPIVWVMIILRVIVVAMVSVTVVGRERVVDSGSNESINSSTSANSGNRYGNGSHGQQDRINDDVCILSTILANIVALIFFFPCQEQVPYSQSLRLS